MASRKQRAEKAARRAAHAARIDARPAGQPRPSDVRSARKAELKAQRRQGREVRRV
jgi:hypothetical protein